MSTHPASDGWSIRILKFVSIVLVLGLLIGGSFALFDYARQFTGDKVWKRDESRERVEQDTIPMLKRRFLIGAGVGSMIGLIYVGRCLVRKEEP